VTRPDFCASAFLVALGAAACVAAYRLGPGDITNPGAGFMPLAAAALLALLALGQLARGRVVGAGTAVSAVTRGRWSAVVVVLATLAGFGRVLETAGFAISTFLMLAVLFGVVARKRWWVAVLVAVLVAALARLAVTALGLPLPEGPLGI
jgi:hypothetical protein